MAERLGTGLQNLLQQFDSAWHLDLLVISEVPLVRGASHLFLYTLMNYASTAYRKLSRWL